MLPVQIKILDDRIRSEFDFPNYQTDMSAGLDLVACIDEIQVILPGETKLIPTGISVYIGDPNFASIILPRSGMGHRHGLVLGNGTGLIDADYQGPLMISAFNRNHMEYRLSERDAANLHMTGKEIIIHPGDRIAQLMFVPIARAQFNLVAEFTDVTVRGEGGFGHTGDGSQKTLELN